jgi:hypothetical protein
MVGITISNQVLAKWSQISASRRLVGLFCSDQTSTRKTAILVAKKQPASFFLCSLAQLYIYNPGSLQLQLKVHSSQCVQ